MPKEKATKFKPKGKFKASKEEKAKKLEDALIVLDEITKVRVAPSSIHGVGLFAMRDIKKGQKLYTGTTPEVFDVPYKLFRKLRPEVSAHILSRWPQIVNGSHFLSDCMLAVYLNHSDQANYDAKADKVLKDIKKGEEVTEDYRKIEGYKKIYTWLK